MLTFYETNLTSGSLRGGKRCGLKSFTSYLRETITKQTIKLWKVYICEFVTKDRPNNTRLVSPRTKDWLRDRKHTVDLTQFSWTALFPQQHKYSLSGDRRAS